MIDGIVFCVALLTASLCLNYVRAWAWNKFLRWRAARRVTQQALDLVDRRTLSTIASGRFGRDQRALPHTDYFRHGAEDGEIPKSRIRP
jgi:hypothetical protein